MVFQNNLLMGAASTISTGPFTIDYSCRFNSGDSAYLTRTPGSDGDLKKFTINVWVKRCGLGANTYILKTTDSGYSGWLGFGGTAVDRVTWAMESSVGGAAMNYNPDIKYRDINAWYNLHMIWDTAQDSANDRAKVFINGVQQSSTLATAPSEDADSMQFNNAIAHEIARYGSAYFDGYLAQYCFIDGAALAATSFGEFDDYAVWRPVDPSGLTFGTNGFYLDFADSSDLGNDVSGNNNDFSSSGLAANDQVTDTPTTNYATWNSVAPSSLGGGTTCSNGNLQGAGGGGAGSVIATIGVSSGKWYWEFSPLADQYQIPGMVSSTVVNGGDMTDGTAAGGFDNFSTGPVYGYYGDDGKKYDASSTASYGATFTSGDVIGVAFDADNGILWFSKNGTYQNSATIAEVEAGTATNAAFSSIDTSLTWFPFFHNFNTTAAAVNFGQQDFEETVPSGFNKISTANFAVPAILDGTASFQTTLYTGNGSSRAIDQTGNSTFQPDFVWIKNRSQADQNALFDAPRTATKYWVTESPAVDVTNTNSLTSFDSDGFSLGSGAGGFNDNTENFVAWQWAAGGGAGSANTDGSINTSTTTVNTTNGFSIGLYTGNSTAGATVGHGLGAVPQMIMIKPTTTAEYGVVYHESLGNTKGTYIAVATSTYTGTHYWNDTSPTSTVFTLAGHPLNNGSGKVMVYYCWRNVVGFSHFSSYTGDNSSDGPFCYLGFQPAWLMIKRSDSTGDWIIYDNQRSSYNVVDDQLVANAATAETTGSEEVDFLSNGFKIRASDSYINASGGLYIYAAFAKNPFGGEDASPITAF